MIDDDGSAGLDGARPDPARPFPSRHPGGPVAVVGIGASAGGFKAIIALLESMPERSGLAIVVIQHRTPNNETLMVDLLAKVTDLPVHTAADGMAVEADHIYIAPGGKVLLMSGDRFTVTGPAENRVSLPIDLFFRSLAAERRQSAICVVLSGAGADGTLGLKAIKEAGGLVVVQDPATAGFDSMPQSAIATGMADYVLRPERMTDALVAYIRQPYLRAEASGNEPLPDGEDLDHILRLMQARNHHDYRAYKTRTLVRRIERRMGIHHIDSMRGYRDFLGTHPGEVEQLARDILISVTRFFRDPEAFAILDEAIVGPMLRGRGADRPIRVWVPGCATGEEVYSIAILLMEARAAAKSQCDIKVFGSDIDTHALDVARAGVYPETIAVDVPEPLLARYFVPVATGYKVSRPLREAVTFAAQNMISDPPFSNLDLISCRNVLIYIDTAVQRSILDLFHFSLADGGHLFLGSAETTGSRSDLFMPVSKKWRLYLKLGTGRRRIPPLPGSAAVAAGVAQRAPVIARASPAEITRQALLVAFAPAAVLIDAQHRLLYLHGPTGDFLDLPTGEMPHDLTSMMRGDLRLKVRAAVKEALSSDHRVTVTGVRQRRAGVLSSVTVTVVPVRPPLATDRLVLVTFQREERAEAARADGDDPADDAQATAETSVIEQLEQELRVTRDDLSATIQELEASNEALRAANEEILSINEELQSSGEEMETSKEELQSLNEELGTVNSQLHEKVEELEVTTNDLTNLLTSTDIATLFLSPDLRIKRFTAPATRLFSLIPTDVGRPITDVSRHFSDPDFIADIRSVLDTLSPMEREVQADGGVTLLRRIHPYRTQDNRIEGTVVTLSDVTALKRTAGVLAERARQQKLVADLGREALGDGGAEVLLSTVPALVATAFGADAVGIFTASDEAMEMRLLEGFGWDRPDGADRPVPGDPSSHVGQVFWSRQPLVVGDFAADRRVPGGPPLPGVASGIGVAFGGDDANRPSVLALYSRQPGRFSDDDLEFVQAVANILGLAVERAAIQDKVRAARDFAEAIVDTVREPLLVLDAALTVASASQAYYSMFAATPETTIGHSLAGLAGGLFRTAGLDRHLMAMIEQGSTIEALEIDAGHDEEGPRTLQINARPLNRSERLILVGIEDVTGHLRARRALAAAKAVAEQASAGKTRFLAAASHDLRQPVQAAVLFHHLLSTQELPPDAARLLTSLGNTLTALHTMLDEILHVSRLDAGVVDVQPRSFRLGMLIGRLVEEFQPLARAAGLTLRCVDTSISVRSDPKLLGRILQNLLANAVKYTDRGRVLIGCRRSGGTVRIQVWDTGRGIPAGQLTAIFEEFHQVGNLGRDRRQGLGLGLSIVDRLATLLDHPISVRSTPDRGSVFEVAVPITDRIDTIDEPSPEVPVDGRGRRVLVIDDDPVVLDSVRRYLEQLGFDVDVATDRDTALNIHTRGAPPDLVIADYRLGGEENGADAIRQLRSAFGMDLPGIILTGDTSPQRIRDASRSGFSLLHKPVAPPELSAAVRSALAVLAGATDADAG
ncbi:response regulator [Azospirillum sp. RWY-5-1]|uniref:histidine kinase n=1 Tax=Azospirillum oleiclasticum TaxID=2735135 RepID=A0ABX2T5R1_9PROT|nr:chemotaxis protein CheB [Azospirillum oleiclasticum]NYZ11460.1 response regulator [Azospirillum oleiclasticum]NYZ18621.1 response regulator [Azospirillum oleiclasticum]